MKSVLILPFDIEDKKNTVDGKLAIFNLPNPSNIEDKPDLELILHGSEELQKVYQVKTQKFSKGSTYNKIKEREQYNYKDDSIPVKSLVLHDTQDMHMGELSSNGEIRVTCKYDLTFSLIGAFFKSFLQKRGKDALCENDYFQSPEALKHKTAQPEYEEFRKVLNYVDFHETLIYQHNQNWQHVSKDLLISKLKNIAEIIVESDEEYFKVTNEKIVEFIMHKIEKIVKNFPKSIEQKFLKDITDEKMLENGKKLYALNLLVSLIPLAVYETVYKSLHESTKSYHEYLEKKQLELEGGVDKKLLLKQAMNVGAPASSSPAPPKKAVPAKRKAAINLTQVKVSRGAIDGFFKKRG